MAPPRYLRQSRRQEQIGRAGAVACVGNSLTHTPRALHRGDPISARPDGALCSHRAAGARPKNSTFPHMYPGHPHPPSPSATTSAAATRSASRIGTCGPTSARSRASTSGPPPLTAPKATTGARPLRHAASHPRRLIPSESPRQRGCSDRYGSTSTADSQDSAVFRGWRDRIGDVYQKVRIFVFAL